MRAKELREHCDMDGGTQDLLKDTISQFALLGRGHDRRLKVSRTIADLEHAQSIKIHHVAKTINYHAFDQLKAIRMKERKREYPSGKRALSARVNETAVTGDITRRSTDTPLYGSRVPNTI